MKPHVPALADPPLSALPREDWRWTTPARYIYDSGRIRKISADGIITTIAGDGKRGYSGDGGPAHNSHTPFRFNLYIADTRNNRIRRIPPGGIIATVAGKGTPD